MSRAAQILCYGMLSVLLLGLTLYYAHDIIALTKKFSAGLLIYIVLLQIPLIGAGGLAFDCLAKPYGIQLKHKDWIGLSFIANLLNQFLPYRPGMGFRYWYLQRHYQLKGSQFIIIMLIYLALMVLMSGLFVFVGWIFLRPLLPTAFNQLLIVSGICGIILIFLWIFLQKNRTSQVTPLLRAPRSIIAAWGVMGIIHGLSALIFYKALLAVGAPVTWSACLFLVGICTLASIFPITPSNIGILESLAGTFSLLLYNDFALGFTAAVLYRTTQWVPALLLGSFFSFLLLGSAFPAKIPKLGLDKIVG